MHNLENEQSRRILVIDDNPLIHEDYRKILLNASSQSADSRQAEADFFRDEKAAENMQLSVDVQVDSAYQGQEALEKVRLALQNNRPYSMAFVDMRMPPGWDGLRTAQELWRVQPDLQVVICTAYSDHTWNDICHQVGYTDQLLVLKKPFDNVEVAQLVIALTKKWELTHDARLRQHDLERLVEERTAELQLAVLRDPLTGISNRTIFNERLEHALAEVNLRSDSEVAVYLIDLDAFKGVNDTLGHPAGDQLVQAVARRLEEVAGEMDCVARLGGDEFAILQAPSVKGGASLLAKKLFRVMEAPFEIESNRLQIRMSCGIAVSPQHGSTSSEIMKNADLALYRAKADGRNCYRFFEEDMDRRIKQERLIAGELEQAIAMNQFVLHYQPIMDAGGQVSCYEALIRWNHPKRGLLAPIEFLSVAEYTGLIGPIGKWVVEQACEDALKFPGEVGVSVNVSAVQFRHNELLTTVHETLTRTGLSPTRLKLEIVESVVLRSSEEVMRTLDELHEMGVNIAMDDFGTGYSSLSNLRMFPFDCIKLDRSFVNDAPDCDEAMGIVQAVATLGKSLNLELTAEGVETESHLECVLAAGYDFTQGYYHARPMSLEDVLQSAQSPVGTSTQ